MSHNLSSAAVVIGALMVNVFIEFIQYQIVWIQIRTDVLWFKSYELFHYNGQTDGHTEWLLCVPTCRAIQF